MVVLKHGLLIAALAVAVPASAAAEGPGWQAPLNCSVDPGDSPGPISPLYDGPAAEIRSFGHSYRLVGNKAFTRLGSHSWVAFTFDDGPSYKKTPQVLAALEKYDVPATFFVNGTRFAGTSNPKLAQRNADMLREIVARGFHVGNHTYHHKNLAVVSAKVYKAEIERGAQAIEDATGVRPHLVRFPYGVIAEKLRRYLAQEGYAEVRWNIDSGDFYTTNRTTLRKRTIKQIISWNGGVVLFHDPKTQTAGEIAAILDDLESLNCRRLAKGGTLLIPVSLHYFAREADGELRPVPPEVAARTDRYMKNLPGRCEARIDKSKATH